MHSSIYLWLSFTLSSKMAVSTLRLSSAFLHLELKCPSHSHRAWISSVHANCSSHTSSTSMHGARSAFEPIPVSACAQQATSGSHPCRDCHVPGSVCRLPPSFVFLVSWFISQGIRSASEIANNTYDCTFTHGGHQPRKHH